MNGSTSGPFIDKLFAENGKKTCTPHSAVKNNEFRAKFEACFKLYSRGSEPVTIESNTVDICIQKLKRAKSLDYDGLAAEHLLFAHPHYHLLLKNCLIL